MFRAAMSRTCPNCRACWSVLDLMRQPPAVFMLGAASATPGFAQSVPAYGAPFSIDRGKQVAAAALAEMRKKGFEMTIAIVDSGSNLVYLERSNQAAIGTIDAAQDEGRQRYQNTDQGDRGYDPSEQPEQSACRARSFSGRRRSASRCRWPSNRCDRRQWRHAR